MPVDYALRVARDPTYRERENIRRRALYKRKMSSELDRLRERVRDHEYYKATLTPAQLERYRKNRTHLAQEKRHARIAVLEAIEAQKQRDRYSPDRYLNWAPPANLADLYPVEDALITWGQWLTSTPGDRVSSRVTQ